VTTHSDTDRFRPRDRVVGRRPDDDPVIRLEIYGILVLAFAVALFLALVSFDGADVDASARGRDGGTHNLVGPLGAHVADLFLRGLGGGAFVLTLAFGYFGVTYLIGRRARITRLDVIGWLGALLTGAVLCHVVFSPAKLLDHPPGGETGAWIGEISAALLSRAGTVIIYFALFAASVILITRRSIFELWDLVLRIGRWGVRLFRRMLEHGDRAEGEDHGAEEAPKKRRRFGFRRGARAAETEGADAAVDPEGAGGGEAGTPGETPPRASARAAGAPVSPGSKASPAPSAAARAEDAARDPEPVSDPDDVGGDVEAGDAPGERAALAPPAQVSGESVEGCDDDDDDIKIVESAAMRRRGGLAVGDQLSLGAEIVGVEQPYVLPGLSLLDYRAPESTTYDREHLRRNAQILEAKLADYRVKGKVVEIHPGPVVTMYEFLPAPGVKISTIANLSDDLAMALSALRIRIVAPIPGKNVVGIEVPNRSREIVWLKEILSDAAYSKAKSKLTLALGKDIVGNPTVMNLQKAPHLLVAGATGSGKSVAINTFVCSILYSATPEDVRLIMVDPKMLELSIYEGIPHLLLPVVTDPKQAATALRWAVKEMERRYKLMADMGVRNLASFNAKVESLKERPGQALPERLRLARLKREAKGEPDPPGVVLDADGTEVEKLPLIVVIIDELADLMMVASKEVEHSIARLAQMARASGIHLVLATQRPSVDVITGLIKANFPTRISFQVASKVDSRTILDRGGAENLLGMGDMLFLPPGTSQVQRVHGAFVSEEEVHQIVAHLKAQGKPDYDLGILTHDDEDADGGPVRDGDEYDEMYDQAVRIVAETRNASISFLQRKLKIGYNRSARIVEKMELEGLIGPSDGTSRPREVFIDPI